MRHTQVFVYGTLRVCAQRWASDYEVSEPICDVTTKGALYDYGGYPYADFDGDGIITGDILDVSPEGLERIRRVELNAGYVEREVIVETPTGHVLCVTYDADERTKERTLPRLRRVPEDNWKVLINMSAEERFHHRNADARGVFG